MTKCDSSLISAYEFDFDASILLIVFKSTNEVRQYTNFPPELFWEFEESESKGKFFNSRIKAQFEVLKSGKVSDEQIAAAVAETGTPKVGIEGENASPSNTCEEASPFGGGAYVPCGAPATKQVYHRKDNKTYAMCAGCADHNVRNRGGVYVGGPVIEAPAAVVAPDLGITDSDIQSVDPGYNPSPVRDENLTPEEEEALAEPAKKKTAVDGVLSQWNALVTTQPAVLKIVDAAHYTQVAETLKRKVGIRDTIFGILDPIREIVYKAYKDVMERQKAILAPIDESIKADKTALLAYDQEQQRIAREVQQKAQREADEAAAKERQRQSDELRLQVAQQHAEAGDTEQAELALSDETIQAPLMPVYAPYVPPETPKIEGQSSRKNWKVDESSINMEELVLDAAEGIKSVRAGKGTLGHAPVNVFKPNIPALNQAAKSSERPDLYPGVKAFNDAVMNVRR